MEKKTALLIMAAGIGSRFGGGIKQLTSIDADHHLIIDYSIHDAIEAGFNKIIFVIRHDIDQEFREAIGNRIEAVCAEHGVEVAYAYQSMTDIPDGAQVPEGRKKPWGTGQAVLAARDLIDTPFMVINADDYYGKKAFHNLHSFLVEEHKDSELCMAGFILGNTLSENGEVTRGICQMENGYLTDVCETKHIVKTADGAEAEERRIAPASTVSMNMWGLPADFVGVLKRGFQEFFDNTVSSDPMGAEYLLPIYINELLHGGQVSVRVIDTDDKWFGVTYKEDRDSVVSEFGKLISSGVYAENLYSDLK
jgi:hypothetical protein